jgi:putative transposase
VLTDGAGIPLGIAIDGANRPDYQLMEETLRSVPVVQPEPTPAAPQHLCLDNGYDYAAVYDIAFEWGYTLHIRPRGEEAKARVAGERARRWVVERTHSWLHRFRRLLIRWEKKPGNYLAFLHFAAALITFRACDWPPKELPG